MKTGLRLVALTVLLFGILCLLPACGGQHIVLPTSIDVAQGDVKAAQAKALLFLEDLQTATIDARKASDLALTAAHQSQPRIDQVHGWFIDANKAIIKAAVEIRALVDPTWAKLKAVLDPVLVAIQPLQEFALSTAETKHSFGDWLAAIGGIAITLLKIYSEARS